MYAVNGFYTGEDTVKIEKLDVPVSTPYKVIVTFVEPAHPASTAHTSNSKQEPTHDEDLERKRAAFASLSKFHKTLPADFDYKKERDAYYEERYEKYMRSH
jgi:hypothetical protein